jgi:hypothetical protein
MQRRRWWIGSFSSGAIAAALTGGVILLVLAKTPAVQAQNPIAGHAPAAELVGGTWLNTPRGAPLSLSSRRGKVTILHFWTFG